MRPVVVALALALLAPLAGAHPETPDCGLASDAGDRYESASAIPRATTCAGQLNTSWDSTDFYKVTCAANESLVVVLTSDHRALNLRIYLPVAVPYALAWEDTSANGRAEATVTCPIPGEYRIQVFYGGIERGIFDVPYALEVR